MNYRNIRLFYGLEAILALSGGIILPVYVLYFRASQVTLFQVALLAAVFEASIILFEVPTGRFADRFGRRLSTVIGFGLMGVAGLIFSIYRDFHGFLAAEIIMGIGESFISGALEALAVESVAPGKRPNVLAGLFANRTVFRTSGLLAGMILGGFIISHWPEAVFWPMIFLGGTGAFLALALRERQADLEITAGTHLPSKSTLKAIFGNRLVMILFGAGLLANFAFEPADQYWQVMFSEIRHIPPVYFGIMTAAGLSLVVLTGKLTSRLYRYLSGYLSIAMLIAAAGMFLAAVGPSGSAIAGIIAYFAVRELIRPAISTHLNRSFEGEKRATYLSFYNLTCSIGEVAAGLLAGILAAWQGVVFVFYFAVVAGLFLTGFVWTGLRRKPA